MKKRLVFWAAAFLLFTLLSLTGKAETVGSFTVTGGTLGTGYTYFANTLVFTAPGDYTVSGTGNGLETIVVDTSSSTAGNPVHITLDGVDIQLDTSVTDPAFKLETGVYVHLTLIGDNRLTSSADYAGLRVAGGSSLVIDGSGALLAEGGARGAGIGGNNGQDGGDITILSGLITSRNYGYAAGIGGGFGGNGGSVVISGGDVTASSSFSGAGIGGGSQNPGGSGGGGGSITISGGRVAANGDTYGAGIGGGMNGSGGNISITGGQVIAAANYDGAGIGGGYNGDGGTIHISGGVIDAQGGPEGGAGVGGGSQGNGGSITILGGELTAVSLGYGAGIGGGSGESGGTIVISGTADIVARGDDYGSGIGQGAGIGGGYNGSGGTISISGAAVVKATGGSYAAGIGGGAEGNGHGGTISISGTANVFAWGGGYAAGIGGGKEGNGGIISISDTAVVDTNGGDYGAGIGGGRKGDGGTISISGSRVTATGGGNAAGIGGGDGYDGGGNGGVINISGGTIMATGTGEGAGIGGGSHGGGAAVTITGGSIAAIPGAALSSEYGIGGGVSGSAGTVRDGSGQDVYFTNVALESVSAATGVTSLTVDSGAYGINDMYTDEYGNLYLYLPNGAHTTEARTASKRYTGYVTTYTYYGDSSGTLMWYRHIDTDGTYNIGDYYGIGQTLHIDGGLNVTLTGSAGATYTNFQLECGSGIRLTLQDVNIDDSAHEDVWPLSFTGTGNTLTLSGVNTMKAGPMEAGVRVETGTELTIGGTGTLTATGGGQGAGIGGGSCVNGGTVTISGGTVTATGGDCGAGIGGGNDGNGGMIRISGGTVTATGGYTGAGIGGGSGSNGDGGSIEISGGTVTATGGDYGAGIGGGYQGDGGTVTFSGGVVFAEGKNGGKDIGAGYTGSGGSLEIADTAAVFLRNDNCVAPVTTTHTHQSFSGHGGSSIYGIPVVWTGNFGAYLYLCTLSFDLNGVTGTVPGAQTVLHGQTVTLPDGSGLSGGDATFQEWNTQSDGSGTAYESGVTYVVTGNVTLYAKWGFPLTGTATVTGSAVYGQTLSASLAGGNNTGILSYQWTRNGTDIPGANGTAYILLEADIGAVIAVKISSSEQTGTVTSAPTLAVEKADCTVSQVIAPVLSGRTLTSITVAPVTGYEYILAADGADITTGIWQDSNDFLGLAANTPYDVYQRVKETETHKASATSEKLDVSTDDSMAYGKLQEQSGTIVIMAEGLFAPNARLIVAPITAGEGLWEALESQLTVEKAFAAYEISIEPSNAFMPPLTLTFQVDSKYNGYTVYILHRLKSGAVEKFAPIVENGLASVTVTELSPFLLAEDPGPKIIAQPQNVTIVTGQTASFEVEAEGVAPLTFRWQRQAGQGAAWMDIQGSAGAKHTTAQANMSNSGYRYRVIVTDGRWYSVTSEAATLTVTAVPEPPDTGDTAHPIAYALLTVLLTLAGFLLLSRRRAA